MGTEMDRTRRVTLYSQPLRRLLPCRTDRIQEVIWKLLRLAAILAAAVALVAGLGRLHTYAGQRRLEKDIRQEYAALCKETVLSAQATQEQRDAQVQIDRTNTVKMLREEHKDIVGWLNAEGAGIQLPVLQGSESTYYATHTYTGKKSVYGSLYLHSENRVYGDIQVLQGENRKDGLMLGNLWKYFRLDVLKTNGILHYDTAEEAGDWRIFAVFKVNTDPAQGDVFAYAPTSFASGAEKANYLYQLSLRTVVHTGVTVNEKDDLLLIASPASELPGVQNVIAARRVRPEETVLKGLSNAAYNIKPLYPEIWYEKNGGEAPEYYPTMEQARRRGKLLSWYDGTLI